MLLTLDLSHTHRNEDIRSYFHSCVIKNPFFSETRHQPACEGQILSLDAETHIWVHDSRISAGARTANNQVRVITNQPPNAKVM